MAGVGIVTSSQPPNAVVQVQPGMEVQPVILVDQNGNYVNASSGPDWIDVTSYGAVGNGSTDDTTAIQDAINAATENQIVYLPAGTYKISSVLTIGSGATLLGDGPQATIIKQVTTTADAITFSPSGTILRPRIMGLQLYGPSSGTGRGISGGGTSNVLVALALRDVYITFFGGFGVEISTPITSVLDNCEVNQCGGGFHLFGLPTSLTITSCWAAGNTGRGWYIQNAAYISMNGCAADANNLAYEIDSGLNVTLTGCGCENTTVGDGLDGTGFKISGGSGVTLTGCLCVNNPGVAFWATASAVDAVFIGCQESSPAAGATASFQLDAGTSAYVIAPTYVTATSYAGTCTVISNTYSLLRGLNLGATSVYGQLDIAQVGNGLSVAEGSNAKQGTAVLSSGSKVVSNTAVTANSRIFLTIQSVSGTPGAVYVSARSAGTSFTITSTSGSDASTVAYEIIEPG